GAAAAWLVLKSVVDIDFVFLPGSALLAAAAALVMTLLIGLAGTWRVLGHKAPPLLRNLLCPPRCRLSFPLAFDHRAFRTVIYRGSTATCLKSRESPYSRAV